MIVFQPRIMIASEGLFAPPRNIWQSLKTQLVVTTGGRGAISSLNVDEMCTAQPTITSDENALTKIKII